MNHMDEKKPNGQIPDETMDDVAGGAPIPVTTPKCMTCKDWYGIRWDAGLGRTVCARCGDPITPTGPTVQTVV